MIDPSTDDQCQQPGRQIVDLSARAELTRLGNSTKNGDRTSHTSGTNDAVHDVPLSNAEPRTRPDGPKPSSLPPAARRNNALERERWSPDPDELRAPPEPKSSKREPNWLVVALVSAILGALVLEIVTLTTDPVIHAVSELFGNPGTPTRQFDQIAASMQKEGDTVEQASIAFQYGPKVRLMVLTPDHPTSSSRSAELRVYSIPSSGRVTELFSFRPELIASASTNTAADPLRHLWTPTTFGIRIRRVAALDGGVGNQALIDLHNPQEPNLEVSPLVLSENSASGKFSLVPLLSPTSIGATTMTTHLSTKYLRPGNWASEARTSLYGRALRIANAANRTGGIVSSYAVSQYGISTEPTPGTSSGGQLTLAAGYAVRGGDVPTPTVMQILVWRIDLTGASPHARAFSAIPQFVPLPPSTSPTRIELALSRAAHLLPPTTESR